MPEVPICIHCERIVDTDSEDYVIRDKREAVELWVYAHADCYALHQEPK